MSSENTPVAIGDDATDDILEPKPNTVAVLGVLVMTSFAFSYLGTYALSRVLVRAEMLRPWPSDTDPRPRWLAIAFCVLLATFGLVGVAARHLSKRQLKRIDQMADGTDGGAERTLRSSLTP
jgi:hypothetical protein